jgi:LuxR family maltose regulon positive regulatory protein
MQDTRRADVMGVGAVDERPPLAEAKLAPPVLRPEVIERPRILRGLDAGEQPALTLVVAPPGYGKTTAVRAWCASRDAPLAWVTLDAGDNDPVRLWTYVATSVDRVREGLGRSALRRLRTPGAPIEAAIDELMNGIGAFDRELVVVLDELETVSDAACLASIDHAVDGVPTNLRLVLVARSDPALRVPRLRVRGALVELRAGDLAFTAREVRAFLGHRTDLRLGDAELEMLRERTEGWPAALELAALWLRDQEDPEHTVREFRGDHRFVAEFLSHEVLDALDDDVRSFLLRASVLGRFTAGLCDNVLDRSDSAALLARLERSNLFVARLEHGGWYRVHPLFAEYATFRLAEEDDPEASSVIHRRAAEWFVSQGLPADAARHAAAAGDLDLVARLLVQNHLALIRGGGAGTLLRWVETLPEEQLLDHPELAAGAATAATMLGKRTLERRRFLALADRAAAERPERAGAYTHAIAAMVRAGSVDGRLEDVLENGRRAVELSESGADDVLVASLAAHARALYFAGDLDAAWATALRAVEHPDAERRAPGHAFARSTLALVAADRGHLASARVHAEKARAIMGGVGTSRSWLGANALAALGLVRLAEGEPAEAERELASAERIFRDEVATVHHVWLSLLLSRARCRRGRLDAALSSLAAARDEIAELVDATPVEPLLADVAGELADARGRAGGRELDEPPSDAELAVLRLLRSELTTRQIGAELYLSPNTVRSHTRALYRKLGVNARVDAVARAEVLGLVAGCNSPG